MVFSPALTQCWFPARTWYREVAVVAVGAALIAALARAVIPLSPVPVTGQTLGVLLVGGALGFRRVVAAVALYVTAGACGLPVFAGGTALEIRLAAGPAVLAGPTAGYLIGFLVAAGTVGLAAEHGLLNRFDLAFLVMVLATLPVFAFGLAWLSHYVPRGMVLEAGLYPFLWGAIAKVCLATLLLPTLQRFSVRSARSTGRAPRKRGS